MKCYDTDLRTAAMNFCLWLSVACTVGNPLTASAARSHAARLPAAKAHVARFSASSSSARGSIWLRGVAPPIITTILSRQDP